MQVSRRSWLDRVGAVVGTSCAVHCLVLPVLVGVLPLLGGVGLQHPMIEAMLLITAVGVGGLAAVSSLLGPRPTGAGWLLVVGVGLLAVRIATGEDGLPGGDWLTVAASLIVVVGHLWRAREVRAC